MSFLCQTFCNQCCNFKSVQIASETPRDHSLLSSTHLSLGTLDSHNFPCLKITKSISLSDKTTLKVHLRTASNVIFEFTSGPRTLPFPHFCHKKKFTSQLPSPDVSSPRLVIAHPRRSSDELDAHYKTMSVVST